MVYRNPFSPRRFRPLYYFLIAWAAIGGTASAILAGASPHRSAVSMLFGPHAPSAQPDLGALADARARGSLSGAPDLLVWDLVYLPCISLYSVGGLLYLLMRALLLQRHQSAFAHVSDLARLRAVRHCGAYLCLYGLCALPAASHPDGHCALPSCVVAFSREVLQPCLLARPAATSGPALLALQQRLAGNSKTSRALAPCETADLRRARAHLRPPLAGGACPRVRRLPRARCAVLRRAALCCAVLQAARSPGRCLPARRAPVRGRGSIWRRAARRARARGGCGGCGWRAGGGRAARLAS